MERIRFARVQIELREISDRFADLRLPRRREFWSSHHGCLDRAIEVIDRTENLHLQCKPSLQVSGSRMYPWIELDAQGRAQCLAAVLEFDAIRPWDDRGAIGGIGKVVG